MALADTALATHRISKTEPYKALLAYFEWSTTALRRLVPLLGPKEAERLIATPRHWMLQAASPESIQRDRLQSLVSLELEERSKELLDAATEIQLEFAAWGGGKAVVAVLDTNILIDHHQDLLQVNWNSKLNEFYEVPVVLAIPMKVIDELDTLKDRGDKIRGKARLALKMIEDTFRGGLSTRLMLERSVSSGSQMNSAIMMKIVEDDLEHVPLAMADSEIVDRALSVSSLAKQTWVITNDTGMRFRAVSAGLRTDKLSYEVDVQHGR